MTLSNYSKQARLARSRMPRLSSAAAYAQMEQLMGKTATSPAPSASGPAPADVHESTKGGAIHLFAPRGLGTLRDWRTFCMLYPEIRQPVVGELLPESVVERIRGPVDAKFQMEASISKAVLGKLALTEASPNFASSGCKIRQPVAGKLPTLLKD